MKRVTLILLLAIGTLIFLNSCREKTPEEKIKDGIEEVGEGIKDAVD